MIWPGSQSGARPLLAPLSAQWTGQSGRGQAAGTERGSEARCQSRAGEATAEPAGSVAAPRSARLRPIGGGPPPPPLAQSPARVTSSGVEGERHPLPRASGRGIAPPAHSLGLEGLDLVGLDICATALCPVDIDGGETETRTDLVGRDLDL
jgi:hypothetical protein